MIMKNYLDNFEQELSDRSECESKFTEKPPDQTWEEVLDLLMKYDDIK